MTILEILLLQVALGAIVGVCRVASHLPTWYWSGLVVGL